MWTKQLGKKKEYYIKEFNHTWDHDEIFYLRSTINGKAIILIAHLRTGSHHLICETGRWKLPKEDWEERMCIFYSKSAIETKCHFINECVEYEDIRNQFENKLKVDSLNELFEGTKLHKTTSFLLKIHNKRTNMEKSLKMD